ncbi:MAG: hypothetical protein M3P85_00225 [Actinomycetota bacterium]|nr:hypothetical protein [Actinomycetota bacterium]
MTADRTAERVYRFAPLDRCGWILGLGASQCLALGGGVIGSGLLLDAGAPAPAVGVPVLLALVFAFGSCDRRALHEWLPVAIRHRVLGSVGAGRWSADVPLLSGNPYDGERQPDLPPFLDGLSIIDIGPLPWARLATTAGVAVVRDVRGRTVSGSVRVRGRGFSLLERRSQDRLVQLWGDALASFCAERGPVSRVTWTEWAASAGVAEHERFVAARGSGPEDSEAVRSYRELLDAAGPLATRHEVIVTVTVDLRRLRARRRDIRQAEDVGAEVLAEQLRLLTFRLEEAGLEVDPPLSPVQTAEILRLRCDPGAAPAMATRSGTLAAMAGTVSRYSAAPLASSTAWRHVRADGSLHRTYWVSEWPRLDVPPNWLEPMLLHAGGVRTFALHCEPVAPSRSRKRIERDSTRLATDEEQRTRTGFRIGARHRRAQAAVLEREAELVAGYAELEYAGFLTVSAPDEDALDRSCAEYEQVAAQAGLELRALDGRHDLGLVCSLPVGRGLARRWLQ